MCLLSSQNMFTSLGLCCYTNCLGKELHFSYVDNLSIFLTSGQTRRLYVGPLFEEIIVEKVSDKISEQLIKLIIDGKLKPGDKLPGERQLIELFGVGRSSLREALNRLETLGYIEVHKRKGNFVKSVDATLQLHPLKDLIRSDLKQIVQLYDIRRDIEQFSAYNAALQRTEEDLIKIERCVADMRQQMEGNKFSWDADQSFHIAIAQATHNFLRVHVTTNIFEFSEEFLKPANEEATRQDDTLKIIADQHEAIYRAIAQGDADQARRKMAEHLLWTNEKLTKLLGR